MNRREIQERSVKIPSYLSKFPVSEISTACSCLSISPSTTTTTKTFTQTYYTETTITSTETEVPYTTTFYFTDTTVTASTTRTQCATPAETITLTIPPSSNINDTWLYNTYPTFKFDAVTGRRWAWFNGVSELNLAGWFILTLPTMQPANILAMYPSGFIPVPPDGSGDVHLFEFEAPNPLDTPSHCFQEIDYLSCEFGELQLCPGAEGTGQDLYIGESVGSSAYGLCTHTIMEIVHFCTPPPVESN